MSKRLTLSVVAVTLLIITGCDAGSNAFSQRSEPSVNEPLVQTQVAMLSPITAKEMK